MRARTASSNIVARGFRFDEVGLGLAQKYMSGTMTAVDIIREIESTWGSVGIWWGSIGSSKDDFYGSADQARDYAGWSGDGSIDERWEDMLDLTGGQVDPSGWIEAEIRVVLIAKKPMRDYGIWNPTTEHGNGSIWESTSFFAEGEQLELTEVHYAADRSGNDWKVERVSGLTVTAQDYFMDHRPAGPDYGAPMHDVTEMFSDYFYEDPYSFDHGEDGAREAIQKMIAAKGNPSARVTIYRAVPEGSGGSIRTGDWVTISKAYATQHGYGLDSSQIISASVQASDLWTEGNSVCEWGYHGPEVRTAGTEYAPGPVYRGINTDMLTDDELDEIEEWAAANAYSQNNYQLAEPNYGLIHRIVDRLERNGLGRHWSKDYDVSASFAQDQGDNIAIIFIGDWDGQGVDDREFHRGWDGVQRPSNVEHEKEVTLMPGSRVTLVGVDVVMPNGFTSNIPVPTIQVTASSEGIHPSLQQLLDECKTSDTTGSDMAIVEAFGRMSPEVVKTHPNWNYLLGLQGQVKDHTTSSDDMAMVEELARYAHRTAANDLRVHLFDSQGREMWLEPDFDGNPWTYHPKVMDAVRYLADVAQSSGVYWHMDHNEFIPSTITDFKVYDGPNDVTHEIKEFPQLRGHYATRTAAEPGGVLPWTPSDNGYYWITKTDGTLEAVTNDGVNRMYLHDEGYGWTWEVFDNIGLVERGNFGTAPSMKRGDALRNRANDLLAEFDTRAERRTRGPSWGYQDDYTQAPNTLWSKRATTSQRYAERLRKEGRR